MIIGNTAGETVPLSDTQQVTKETGNLMSRKIWLPKLLYAALPFFYILAGIVALLATLKEMPANRAILA